MRRVIAISNNDGEVIVSDSAADLTYYIELIDVEDGEYRFFTETGLILTPHIDSRTWRLIPGTEVAPDNLRHGLRHFLAVKGAKSELLELGLREMVDIAEYVKRLEHARGVHFLRFWKPRPTQWDGSYPARLAAALESEDYGMYSMLIAKAMSKEELKPINSILHDELFSMDEARLDKERHIARIPIWKTVDIPKSFFGIKYFQQQMVDSRAKPTYILQVTSVDEINVSDPHRLEEHTIFKVKLVKPDRLVIQSNYVGQVEFVIGSLNVEIWTDQNRRPSRRLQSWVRDRH